MYIVHLQVIRTVSLHAYLQKAIDVYVYVYIYTMVYTVLRCTRYVCMYNR